MKPGLSTQYQCVTLVLIQIIPTLIRVDPKKIASYVSPDGYLILGLSNKSGGFQNMLQRMIIFEFTDDENEIIELAKQLFEEDLYRAQTFSKRTINSIIYLITTYPKPSVRRFSGMGGVLSAT